mgnify:CR=1 FL=1
MTSGNMYRYTCLKCKKIYKKPYYYTFLNSPCCQERMFLHNIIDERYGGYRCPDCGHISR